MRVAKGIHRTAAKKAHYGAAVRYGNGDELYIVIDMFVGDGYVRIVNLASGKVLKVPENDDVILIENAYVEIEDGQIYD